MVKYYIKTKVH